MRYKMEGESDSASTSFYGRQAASVCVRNAITKLELSVGLKKAKSTLGNYVWEVI